MSEEREGEIFRPLTSGVGAATSGGGASTKGARGGGGGSSGIQLRNFFTYGSTDDISTFDEDDDSNYSENRNTATTFWNRSYEGRKSVSFVAVSFALVLAVLTRRNFHYFRSNEQQPQLRSGKFDVLGRSFDAGDYHDDVAATSTTMTSDAMSPFSIMSPSDLGIESYYRSADSSPGVVFGKWKDEALAKPTNAWYQNLLLGTGVNPANNNDAKPTTNNRAYTIPYVVDFAGPLAGVRIQNSHVVAGGDTIVQISTIPRHGLTLGGVEGEGGDDGHPRRAYVVDDARPPGPLGLELKWQSQSQSAKTMMKTGIYRGMPYITMEYEDGTMPVIAGEVPLAGLPVVDPGSGGGGAAKTMRCGVLGDDNDDGDEEDSTSSKAEVVRVEKELSLHFLESDFTWLVFVGRPVLASCFEKKSGANAPPFIPGVVATSSGSVFELRIVDMDADGVGDGNGEDNAQHFDSDSVLPPPFFVRAALANNCTSGINPLHCRGVDAVGGRSQSFLTDVLRKHSDVYPAAPTVVHEFINYNDNGEKSMSAVASTARMRFDWGARSTSEDSRQRRDEHDDNRGTLNHTEGNGLLMYSLPHHVAGMQRLPAQYSNVCAEGLHGRACLVQGGEWIMEEELSLEGGGDHGGHDRLPSFVAPRPPKHSAVADLAKAVAEDIKFELPDYYMVGAGDTYFSGKMLAKLGRIIVIASELKTLAAAAAAADADVSPAAAVVKLYDYDLSDDDDELQLTIRECKNVASILPSDDDVASALDRLRRGVEIWLEHGSSASAVSKFIYDEHWGGHVNCGCYFNSDEKKGWCDNAFPNCPSFSDPGLDFGNGFYNDHHFHYGYMIYAAAVVANYDPAWGRATFESVLLLVRDIANPSEADRYFPVFRQKDWYIGSSWASGIASLGGQPYLNGRNQESSSEAINAYEGIALYGAAMVRAWEDDDLSPDDDASSSSIEHVKTASRVRDVGRLLTVTEIRATQRYWHVMQYPDDDDDDFVHFTDGDGVHPKSYKPGVVGMMWQTMYQFQTWFGNSAYLAYGIQLLPLTSVSESRDTLEWARQIYLPFSESCDAYLDCEETGWSVLVLAILAVVGHRDLAAEKAIALQPSVFESAGGNGHSLTNTLWYISTRPDVADPLALPDRAPAALPPTEQVEQESAPLPDAVAIQPVEHESSCPPCTSKVCHGKINRCPQSLEAPFLCITGANGGGCSTSPWIGGCSECCELTDKCFE